METDDPVQLDHVMAHLAAGDLAFAVTLANGWHAPIARVVRPLLRERGRCDLARDREEVAGHVIDACFVVADRAGGWGPGEGRPGLWARFRRRARDPHRSRPAGRA